MAKSQLIGSKRSPFTRRLRMLVLKHPECGVEFKAINYLEVPEDAAYLRSISPINKIPRRKRCRGELFLDE